MNEGGEGYTQDPKTSCYYMGQLSVGISKIESEYADPSEKLDQKQFAPEFSRLILETINQILNQLRCTNNIQIALLTAIISHTIVNFIFFGKRLHCVNLC